MSRTPTPIAIDVLILGGGIAGLWLLALLRARGVRAGLLEVSALGRGQTLWSQGIIHGGVKYALGGKASAASRAISAMPGVWRAALEGRGEVSLRGARVLSESQVLWTTPGMISRVAAVAASKAIRTPVTRLAVGQRPGVFNSAPGGTDVYRVDEPVLDVASVMRTLSAARTGAIARVRRVVSIEQTGVPSSDAGTVRVVAEVDEMAGEAAAAGGDGASVAFDARHVVLTAGSGNAALGAMVDGGAWLRMQTRALHMLVGMVPRDVVRELDEVAARGRGAGGVGDGAMIYGHCLGGSMVPRVTITSVPGEEGGGGAGEKADAVHWLIGGGIAESGVTRSAEAQIAEGRSELRACLPWVAGVLERVALSAGRIDRAEGLTAGGSRPDEPVMQHHGRVSAAWPTKLAFAPLLAERLAERAAELGVKTGASGADESPLGEFARAAVGAMPWEGAT